MDKHILTSALSPPLPQELAVDLVDNFLVVRQDTATRTLGRVAPGKLVETFVQILQFLDGGSYDAKPNVDEYLRSIESRRSSLDDGLRICAARVARAMYSLRSKRSIAHKGQIDPNGYDLQFLLGASQWILAELVRSTSGLSMDEAGRLVDQIQAPIGTLVEDFGTRRLVLQDLPMRDEILVLAHSHYPAALTLSQIASSLDRRKPGSVRNIVWKLWKEKILEGNGKNGYRLTRRGYDAAVAVVKRCLE